jgi:LacI family transcriptional regulator
VLVNRQVRGIASSVVLRDGDAAALGVEHLYGLGHRSVCGVFGPSTLDTMVRRRRGFLRACARLEMHGTTVAMPGRDYAAGHAGGLRALGSAGAPTALLAGTFPMAVGALAAVHEAGHAVPDAVSVLSLHDDVLAEYLVPRLSAVALPAERLGAEAVDLALALLAGGKPRRVVVPDPPQLVVRGTTGPRLLSDD